MIRYKEEANVPTGQRAVDQTLHLQQIVQLPKFNNSADTQNKSSQVPVAADAVTKKPARKQPMLQVA
jgi:hypothetical protein